MTGCEFGVVAGKTFPGGVRGTADPSTSLRSGRDEKGEGSASIRHSLLGSRKQQVPPLRYAPVGMTLLLKGQKNG